MFMFIHTISLSKKNSSILKQNKEYRINLFWIIPLISTQDILFTSSIITMISKSDKSKF
jgi:hypothetical protein